MGKTTKKHSVMIVEDERNTREGLARLLRMNYDVTIAEDGFRAINILKKNNFDIILTDLKMPGADGMEVLEEALKKTPRPSCIILTAYGSIESAVGAMRNGAFDFIPKPVNLDQLELVIQRALETRSLAEENKELKKRLDSKYGFENIIGNSPVMHEVFETVKQVAPTKTTVLITGESGTGKELIAHAIHQLSERGGPFVPVHCAALPANLLESELFGHEKGAFTGAAERKIGRFELADGGTIFLDEIGEIDQATQVKLLRVLETRTFERIGGLEPITTTARIVAATNRDLREMVESGDFREDLFYRLYVVCVQLPKLSERPEDIPLMVNEFIKELAADTDKNVEGISQEALNQLCSYEWKGNVRELRNCVERMVVLSRDRILRIDSVPLNVREFATPGTSKKVLARTSLNLEDNERMLIAAALDEAGGNRTKAAELLGISRRTLHRKLNEYGLS
ncbi:MAG: sigma-54-dependent Fis family transcriptional regulator [Kiritimatiellaeota bacterium]|nr:sigma-54-dependent Fis family transcriptional regulator [Kiritimatiellota bacterium]